MIDLTHRNHPPKLPRLGDRADLRIDIQVSAVQSYQQTRAKACGVILDAAIATAELLIVLSDSYVTYSSGETMRTRARVRRLEVDCVASLIRLTPTHVRCHLATVRRLDVRNRRTRSRARTAEVSTFQVRSLDNAQRIGVVRARRDGSGPVEFRAIAPFHGAPAPPWGPVPDIVHDSARARLATGQRQLVEWLASFGVVVEAK